MNLGSLLGKLATNVLLPAIVGAFNHADSKGDEAAASGAPITGSDKEAIALQALDNVLPVVEGVVGRDLLNDAAVAASVKNLFAAIALFKKSVHDAQAIRNA